MIEGRNGTTYATASEFRDEWPDVTPALLRGWVDNGLLEIVTYGELSDAFGIPVPDGVQATDEARARGRHGPENVYRYRDVSTLERDTRLHRRKHGGRPRNGTLTPQHAAPQAA